MQIKGNFQVVLDVEGLELNVNSMEEAVSFLNNLSRDDVADILADRFVYAGVNRVDIERMTPTTVDFEVEVSNISVLTPEALAIDPEQLPESIVLTISDFPTDYLEVEGEIFYAIEAELIKRYCNKKLPAGAYDIFEYDYDILTDLSEVDY